MINCLRTDKTTYAVTGPVTDNREAPVTTSRGHDLPLDNWQEDSQRWALAKRLPRDIDLSLPLKTLHQIATKHRS